MAATVKAAPNSAASQSTLTVKDLHRFTGRLSGPQQFFSVPFVTGAQNVVPKNIPLDSPVESIQFEWAGRIVIGTANFISVSPESVLNLIPLLKVQGTHDVLNQQTLWNSSAAILFKLAKLFNPRGSSLYINGVRITDDVMSAGIPTTTFGNTGTYDVQFFVTLPAAPFFVNDSQAALYYLNENAWGQTLQINYAFGDATSLGVPGTAVTTFTAFGSGAGSPVMNITVNYAYLGPFSSKIGQAVCIRNDIAINSVLQNNSSQIRLALLQPQKTTCVVAKTGTLQAGTGNPYATLSDTILEQTQLRKNNAPIRNLIFNAVTKENYGRRMATVQPLGYLGIFFDDGYPTPNAWAALEANKWTGGAQFDIASLIVGAAGANQGDIIQEYILGDPVVQL